MAPSLIPRPGRGLNLPNATIADEGKGDRLMKATFDLLEKGENEIKLDDRHKDVILILGNTGSGKSTFTQWVAGDNTKLISAETKEGTGEYIIVDHNRIGDSTLKSKTVFPELVIDPKTNAAYYDCPGFSDTQGTSHDIATTYFIKKVVDHAASVKVIFTISHPSVRKGVDRQDFMKLVRHVTDLVKDFEKFKKSIAIVATKVDNQYTKRGENFVLVEDDKVISAIADFLQEVKKYLGDNSKRPNLTEKEKRFYRNAIGFVDILLEREGGQYPKIGLFRRPDEPGPVSDIPLLQNGKKVIEKILYEKLDFTSKNSEDFGYTVSEKTKIDIIQIGEEINKSLWSSISSISEKIQNYYQNLIQQIRFKIDQIASESDSIEASPSEAEEFAQKFNDGFTITTELANNTKDITNLEKLALIINKSVSNIDIKIPGDDMLYIANQGKYFDFLQTVSDRILNSKPWDELFQHVEILLFDLKTTIMREADSAAKTISNRMQLNLNSAVKAIKDEYSKKIESLEIRKLPRILNQDRLIILESTIEIKNGTTTEKLVNGICNVADNLGVSFPKDRLQNIQIQGNYLKFLEGIKNETLEVGPNALLSSLEDVAKFFYESGKWYSFLEDLYHKFSEYDVQKDRQNYNVANLEDWGQPEKPQGIAITSNNFEKFLHNIENYNVTEYDSIKNLTTTSLHIEELNHVLSLTLKHRPIVRCSEPYVLIKGNYISLEETLGKVIRNSDTNDSCKSFLFELMSGKHNYTLLKVFALNTLFIDTDLHGKGFGLSIAAIAPKWEVIGSRSIDISGSDGAPNAESKAKTGDKPGNRGIKGSTGKPGGSGETFFGVGSDFVNGVNLTIDSNGGSGSRGQDGGDGAPGEPGKDARVSEDDPTCVNGHVNGFKCVERPGRWGSVGSDGSLVSVAPFHIFGLPGGGGGDGGDGGRGGRGGDPGKITILELNQPSNITKLTAEGKDGENGEGGAGGAGGKDGDDWMAQWNYSKRDWLSTLFGAKTDIFWSAGKTMKNSGRGPSGNGGADGANAESLQNPKPANGIRRLPNVINEYKSYIRENLNDRFQKYCLVEFLDQLNKRSEVRKLYDTLGLMDEFRRLEEQFHKLSESMDFSPLYRSLLERIREFAENHKNGEISGEYRKVLSYMHTAILGRIYSLNENKETNMIIDIRGYLNLVKENIKTLEDLQTAIKKVEVINKYKENYKIGIDKKIEEARTFIKKQINPEIENISLQIDSQVNSLIEETIELQKQAEKEKEELAEKKKKLEDALVFKGLFSFFQIIGGVVSFLGPVGAIAGTVIETVSTVSESLALNDQQQIMNPPLDLVAGIKSLGDRINRMKNQKVANLSKLLDEVSEEIKKNPEKLSDMTGKIVEIKDKLKKASENKLDLKQVKVLEVELKRELRRKGEDLKIHSRDKKGVDMLKFIGKTVQIAEFGSFLHSIYDRMKGDKEKTDAITDAMEKIEGRIRTLKEYEENIHDTIAPMLQEMGENMKDISDKLEAKSQVALDVTKWQVQSALKDMRLQMQRLTEGLEVKDHLTLCIEKLDEVMTTLINIYDRIQSFQDQQNLANYVADISSTTASGINLKDQDLANAFKYLEYLISANIVLKQYKSAVDAFKQWVFPFADHYIEKPMLPSQLEINTNIKDLVQNTIKEIDMISKKLDLYNASVQNSDQFLQHGEFSSRYISSQPFFIWKNEEYGSLISRLLSGEEVVLKADVKDSDVVGKDAIKFNVINFYFKPKNETTQPPLSETLKGFDIRATHLGNSYYRYANKIYLITSESVPISYAFEKNDAGVPLRRNDVYDKLKSGDLMLSPYTMWEVKMIKTTNKFSFRDLDRYRGEIDLELSGLGSYVDMNVFASEAHKSFVMTNTTKLAVAKSPIGIPANQTEEYKPRLTRSSAGFSGDSGGYLTNGASAVISSPINVLCNLLRTYIISNAMISISQLIIRDREPANNHYGRSELPKGHAETEETDPTDASNSRSSAAVPADVNSAKEDLNLNEITIEMVSDIISIHDFDDRTSFSKPFLQSGQQQGVSHQSVQVPELNSSLLLADLVTRSFTGNKCRTGGREFLLSPRGIVDGKIRDGIVKNESDFKQKLQRLLSEKEECNSTSWIGKAKRYAKSMFQFLGLAVKDDAEEYLQDVSNLFAT